VDRVERRHQLRETNVIQIQNPPAAPAARMQSLWACRPRRHPAARSAGKPEEIPSGASRQSCCLNSLCSRCPRGWRPHDSTGPDQECRPGSSIAGRESAGDACGHNQSVVTARMVHGPQILPEAVALLSTRNAN